MIKHQQQKGFTLIELVISIVIMGIISVVVGRILFQSYQTFLTSQNVTETDMRGLLAITRMAADIHTIRSAASITTANATQLTFVDVDGNTVPYTVSSGNLLRNSQILASGVSDFTLAYLDKTGATTATPSAVRYISISFSITQNNLTQSFTTLVATRGMS